MDYKYILAKSTKDENNPRWEETLDGHISKVVESFDIIFKTNGGPSSFAKNWLNFFKLKEDKFNTFYINGLASCIFHDIGKANSGFQALVRGKKDAQVIRHEHLTGLILNLKDIRDWLKNINLLDIKIVISSVIGHHLKAKFEDFAKPTKLGCKGFEVFPDNMHTIFSNASEFLNSPDSFPNSSIPLYWKFDDKDGVYELSEKFKREFHNFRRELSRNEESRNFFISVRTALILSDTAGSGLVRKGHNIRNWLDEVFKDKVSLNDTDIENMVIKPRIDEIKKGRTFIWNTFQNAAEDLPERALLLSPCGSGKTLAAWRWIKARLGQSPRKHVVFLYPTRATATEGFRDYVSWAPESDAALIHGTSSYELEDMFETPDTRSDKDFSTEEKLFALAYWHRRIFSATVDQFLGFMQNFYSSICLTPLLADSVLVIDEIHSFDRGLFSILKRFLINFNIPVLCMTASLPPKRKDVMIRDYGLKLFPEDTKTFLDLQAIADMPRYKINSIIQDDAKSIVREAIKSGERVLWVVNTVARCQNLAKEFNALCYHSRYKLDDRKERHKDIIKAFQQKDISVIGITTQVCEMSLDLDATVLITEVSPITSLIQRMGRCNRQGRPGDNKIGKVYIYKPESNLPYTEEDLIGIKEFIEKIDNKEVSQTILEELLQNYGPSEVEPARYAAFLECGPWAVAREESLRDIEGNYSVQAILDCDIALYKELQEQRKPVDGLILSVPKKLAEHKLGRFLMVAPSSHYTRKYGFFDKPQEV